MGLGGGEMVPGERMGRQRRTKGRGRKEEKNKGGRIEREEAKRERVEEVKEGEKEVGREGGGKEGSPAPQPFPGFPGQLYM